MNSRIQRYRFGSSRTQEAGGAIARGTKMAQGQSRKNQNRIVAAVQRQLMHNPANMGKMKYSSSGHPIGHTTPRNLSKASIRRQMGLSQSAG